MVRFRRLGWSGGRQNCSEIVCKDHGVFVGFIPVTASPGVARAEVAIWVVLREISGLWLFCLALPGSLGTMWRDEDVFPGQRVESPVWVSRGVEIREGHGREIETRSISPDVKRCARCILMTSTHW